jgi:hypothetical protein
MGKYAKPMSKKSKVADASLSERKAACLPGLDGPPGPG